MVELNGSGVAASGSQHGEFGMIPFKTPDVADKNAGTPARRQGRVTLRTVCVTRGRKANRSPMIGVTGCARGRKCLRRLMQRAVMAREALLVDDLGVIKTQVGLVASGTLLGENRMRGGQASGGVHPAIPANAIPCDRQDGQRRGR